MSQIEDYINLVISWDTNKTEFYKWILKHGKHYTRDLEIENKVKDIHSHLDIQLKQCFRNSQILNMMDRSYLYIEGFYIVGQLFPMEHAFNIYKNKAFDMTADKGGFDVTELFGVIIPNNILDDYHDLPDKRPFYSPLFYYFERMTKLKFPDKTLS